MVGKGFINKFKELGYIGLGCKGFPKEYMGLNIGFYNAKLLGIVHGVGKILCGRRRKCCRRRGKRSHSDWEWSRGPQLLIFGSSELLLPLSAPGPAGALTRFFTECTLICNKNFLYQLCNL